MILTLFSDQSQNLFIHFDKPCWIDDKRLEYCFLFVLNCDYDLIKIKTAEEVMRNLIQNSDLIKQLFSSHPPDFYEVLTQGEKLSR